MQIRPGQVAVVTGAASGIGFGLAEALVDRGAAVVLSDVRAEALNGAVKTLESRGGQVVGVPTDVTDSASVGDLAHKTLDTFGRVDLVCNNAGVVSPGVPMWEQPLSIWRRMIDIKILGVVYGVKAFAPHLLAQGSGHILNTASSGGLAPLPGRTPYSATMHAIVGLTETLNEELRSRNEAIGATVLCPGLVDTPLGANSAALGLIEAQPRLDERAMNALIESQGGIITARAAAEAALDAISENRVHSAPGGGVYDRARARIESLLSDLAADQLSHPRPEGA